MYEPFSTNPPTAAIYFEEKDWELGRDAGWSLVCQVPRARDAGSLPTHIHHGCQGSRGVSPSREELTRNYDGIHLEHAPLPRVVKDDSCHILQAQ